MLQDNNMLFYYGVCVFKSGRGMYYVSCIHTTMPYSGFTKVVGKHPELLLLVDILHENQLSCQVSFHTRC